ncbi:MAG: (d)CMP kinase [Granulosicoccus sp.]
MSATEGKSAPIPLITIDGPSGAGKGTVAQRLANRLGWHLLDSGAVYRAAALHALREQCDLDDEVAVTLATRELKARFNPTPDGVDVYFGDENVTSQLRNESTAGAASRIAVMPGVRAELLDEQRSFRQLPGLIADGRDMGTIVFPDADLKVFLTASASERAKRRAKQLKDKGIDTTMASLLQEIEARDARDSTRKHAPLKAAEGALVIDSSELDIDQVIQRIAEIAEQFL